MAKRRTDILDRARELTASMRDDELLAWMHMNPEGETEQSLDAQWRVRQTLVRLRDQIIREFNCSKYTADSQIAVICSERTRAHVVGGRLRK
jgi:hypothetical protein